MRHVLVYDMGGGTLDTSLLYMNGNAVSVLSVAGDDHLGGSDFDVQMQRLLEAKLERNDVRLAEASAAEGCGSSGLHILAEEAKIRPQHKYIYYCIYNIYCNKIDNNYNIHYTLINTYLL